MTDRDDEQATPSPDPSWLRPWKREADRPVSTTTFVSPRRKRRSPLSRLADVLPGRGGAPSQPDAPSAREAPPEPPADPQAPTEPAESEQPPAPEADDEADLDRWFDDLDLDPAPPQDLDHGDEDARLDDSDPPEEDVAEAEDDSVEEPVLDGAGASAEAPPAPSDVDDEPETDQPATDPVAEVSEQIAETPTGAPAQPPAETAATDVSEDLDRDETPDDELVDGVAEHPAGDLDEDQPLAVAAFLDDPDDEDEEDEEPSGPDAAPADPTAPAEAPAGVDEEPEQDAPASAEAFEEERTEPDGPVADAPGEPAVALGEGVDEPEDAEIVAPEPHAQVEVETDEPGAEPDETHDVDEKVDDSERDEPALPPDPETTGTADEDVSERATTPVSDREPEESAPAPSGIKDDEPDDTSVVEAVAKTPDGAPPPDPASVTDGGPDDDPSEPQPVLDDVPAELDESDDRVSDPDASALETSAAAPADEDITEAETPAPEPGPEADGEPEEQPTERPAVPESVAPDLYEPEGRAAEPTAPGLGDFPEAVESGDLVDPDLSAQAGPETVATPPEEAREPGPQAEPEADTVSEDEPDDRLPGVLAPGPGAAAEALEDADPVGTDAQWQAPPEPAATALEEASFPEPDGDDEPEDDPRTALAVPEETAADPDESDGTADEPLEEAPTDTDLAEDALEDLDDAWATAEPDVPAEAATEAAATPIEETPTPTPDPEPHDEPDEEPDASLDASDEATAEPDEPDEAQLDEPDETVAELDEPDDHAREGDVHAELDAGQDLDEARRAVDEVRVGTADEPDDHLPDAVLPGPPATAHEPLEEAPTDTDLAEEVDPDLDDTWATAEPTASAEAVGDVDRTDPEVSAEAAPEAAASPIEETLPPAPEPEPDDEPEEEPDASLAVSDEAAAAPEGAEAEPDEEDEGEGAQFDEPDETVAELDEPDEARRAVDEVRVGTADEPDDHLPDAVLPGPPATAHEPLEEAPTDTDLAEEVDPDLDDTWATAEPTASAEAVGDVDRTDPEVSAEAAPEAAASPIEATPTPEPDDEPEEEPDASLAVSDEAAAAPEGAEAEPDEEDEGEGAQFDEPDETVAELDEPDEARRAVDEVRVGTADEPDDHLPDAVLPGPPATAHEPLEEAPTDTDLAEEVDPDLDDTWATAEPTASAEAVGDVDRTDPEVSAEAAPEAAASPIEATPTPEPEEELEAPGALDEEPVEAQATATTAGAPVSSAPAEALEEAPAPAPAPPAATEPDLDGPEHGPWLRDVDEAARDLDDTDRRARRLLAGAALSLLVVAVVFGGVRIAQDRAADAAREQAARQAQVTTLASDVLDLADVVGPTAESTEPLARTLLVTLEEHLLASERSDAELDEARSQAVGELRAAADRLRDALDGPAPVRGALVPADAADPVLLAHARVRAEATALASEADVAADRAEAWGAAVRSVTAALATHARIASEQPETSDPDELAEAWLAEVEPLEALADVADDAADVPGLEAWADAHAAFAEDSLAWVERAAALLEDGDLETYNTELEETLGVDDPFGFSAALAEATRTALDSPVLDAVATVEARAALVAEQVDALERTTDERLTTAAAR